MARLQVLNLIIVTSITIGIGTDTEHLPQSSNAADLKESCATVLPQVTNKHNNRHEPQPKELEILISSDVFNLTVHLLLKLNERLLSPQFTSRYHDEAGRQVITKGHLNCFYQGHVQEHPEWRVVMSTCHGLRGSFGDDSDSSQYYHLEPLNQYSTSLEGPHALYLDLEYDVQDEECGCEEEIDDMPFHDMKPNTNKHQTKKRQSDSPLIVEWVMVNDFALYQYNNENISTTVLGAIEIANSVDMVFQVLNIRVVLVDVITWTNGSLLNNDTTNPHVLLRLFRSYRAEEIETVHDSAMLLTGVNLEGLVGIAFVGTMCNDRSAVGISEVAGRPFDRIVKTTAHELGHNFGMHHDNPPRNCSCPDPTGGCVMTTGTRSPAPTQWSNCSLADLEVGLEMMDLGRCLTNDPMQTVTDPQCGNGIREDDEICDCGTIDECQDPCCDAATCQLSKDAECHSGPCCDSCQLVPYGTTCRNATNVCDIEEYCSGVSSDCPVNLHVQDGYECDGNETRCFSGYCRSFDTQCQFYYGSDSGMAAEECYTILNVQGSEAGNCGSTTTQFLPCSERDALCGQLQCFPGEFMDNTDLENTVNEMSIALPNGSSAECLSFTTELGSDVESPGLVLDGTSCGQGMICLDQHCISLSELDYIRPCRVGIGGLVCSGQGKCNNLNQCSCNVGVTGDACEGERSSKSDNSGVIAGAVVGVILGLLLIAAVVVGVFCFVRWRKPKRVVVASRTTTTSSTIHQSRTPKEERPQASTSRSTAGASVEVKRPQAGAPRRPPPPPQTSQVHFHKSSNQPPRSISYHPRSAPPPPTNHQAAQKPLTMQATKPPRPPPPSHPPSRNKGPSGTVLQKSSPA